MNPDTLPEGVLHTEGSPDKNQNYRKNSAGYKEKPLFPKKVQSPKKGMQKKTEVKNIVIVFSYFLIIGKKELFFNTE